METEEKWMPVRGAEGRYEVSSAGRVRSLDRTSFDSMGRRRPFRGQVLNPYWQGEPRRANVSINEKHHRVHILVLEAFVGERPTGALGCHRDDDPTNNSIENLYWGTREENGADAVRNGLGRKREGDLCPQGHEVVGENAYHYRGHTQCNVCRRERARIQMAKKRAADKLLKSIDGPDGSPVTDVLKVAYEIIALYGKDQVKPE